MSAKVFELKVTKIESTCIFELNWEAGKKITVSLQYPNLLDNYYEQWRKAYLEYYRNLRGRKTPSGKGSVKKDYRSHLVNTHSLLLDEFHRWLFSPELIEIRREIANSVNYLDDNQKEWIEVFLTRTPAEIARLPWETWEIGTDLGIPKRIRIARSPANIRSPVFQRTFNGETDYNVRDRLATVANVWSKCGKSENMRVNAAMSARGKGIATVDSFDIAHRGFKYHIKYRACK